MLPHVFRHRMRFEARARAGRFADLERYLLPTAEVLLLIVSRQCRTGWLVAQYERRLLYMLEHVMRHPSPRLQCRARLYPTPYVPLTYEAQPETKGSFQNNAGQFQILDFRCDE